MAIAIHSTFLPHDDPEASPTFYRDTLGLEVRNYVGCDEMRWITVGPTDQSATPFVFKLDKTHRVDATHDFRSDQ